VDFFEENDMKQVEVKSEKKESLHQITVQEDVFEGLSARERNKLKRKMKMQSKG
jgi:hypothetical protein